MVDIRECSQRRAHALRDRVDNLDVADGTVHEGLNPVGGLDRRRRLGPHTVDLHMTTATRVGRRRPRLEQSDRPEPLIDAGRIHAPTLAR